ncbi:MAG: glycine--tRNA ligase subunit beta [Candidatus Methylomirabilis sp.]|nr:glycine--tRNA ligase subunit beta [Deltaproteobacteria bacterium]
MAKDLLFELGTEELPAGVAPRALSALEGFLRKGLESSKLKFGAIRALGTPRRLTLMVEGLDERQPDSLLEIKGPNTKAAYDAEGKPTGALLGFARSQGVHVSELKSVKTDKGEYVMAIKEVKGEATSRILPDVVADMLSRDFLPKSMRWGSHDISFSRPIHWILLLFGGEPVDFSHGHIKSSRVTYGHRFLSEREDSKLRPVKVASIESYLEGLKKSFVIADQAERKRIISEGIEKAAREAGGSVMPDEALLEEVSWLVEYPVVVRGSFDREFLDLPRDIVVNAMREHQRYFSILNDKGGLLPYFITVANTLAKDMDIVRKGNERVLRARLNDAKFYYEQDVRKPLAEMAEKLKGVVFQAKLGTSYEKAERFTALALAIGGKAGFSRPMDEGEKPSDYLTESFNPARFDRSAIDPGLFQKLVIGRAAMLSKADLTSGVVGEFPKLQGVMGSVYAGKGREAPEVCAAIYEHYMPVSSGGELPASIAGSIVSIADKTDTIAGCFGVGLIPTGAQDPYALRRQALGIIAIILEKDLRLPIDGLVDEALKLLAPKLKRPANEVRSEVLDFFKERLRNQLLSQGLSHDSIDAVLSAPWLDLPDAVRRIKALEGFKTHPDAGRLVTAFKRVSNILKSVEPGEGGPDPALLTEPAEAALEKARAEIAPVMEERRKLGEYAGAFEALASIKDRIDSFFDEVMVMVEDEKIKRNRLKLLASVRDLYSGIADLSKLTV